MAAVPGGVDWAMICTRLRLDANDQAAWDALYVRIRTWAYDRLRDLRPDILEDAVADMCSTVVMDLPAARGPDTFRGFVLGKCLNVAKGAIRLAAVAWTPSCSTETISRTAIRAARAP